MMGYYKKNLLKRSLSSVENQSEQPPTVQAKIPKLMGPSAETDNSAPDKKEQFADTYNDYLFDGIYSPIKAQIPEVPKREEHYSSPDISPEESDTEEVEEETTNFVGNDDLSDDEYTSAEDSLDDESINFDESDLEDNDFNEIDAGYGDSDEPMVIDEEQGMENSDMTDNGNNHSLNDYEILIAKNDDSGEDSEDEEWTMEAQRLFMIAIYACFKATTIVPINEVHDEYNIRTTGHVIIKYGKGSLREISVKKLWKILKDSRCTDGVEINEDDFCKWLKRTYGPNLNRKVRLDGVPFLEINGDASRIEKLRRKVVRDVLIKKSYSMRRKNRRLKNICGFAIPMLYF